MKKLLPLLLAALLPLAASADWVLSGTSGNVTMTDGTYTLNMTVKSAADRTLMLGRTGNTKSNALPGNSQTYSGSFDFTQRIVDGEDNEWTIVEVAPWAFYNNKAISGTIYIPAVTNIGDAAFGYGTGLTGFTLGNKLERIGHGAFVSTFGNLSFTPSLPPSVKFVGQGGIAHHSSWDAGTPMKLSGTIELRGIETLEVSAFYMDINLEKVVIGPKLTEFGTTGTTIDGMANNKGVFERCDKLHTVEWYGPAPASFVQNTFWNNQTTFCVTNYVYIDYFDGWTNAMTACGMSIGSLASGNDPSGVDPADYDTSNPAVYPVASNVKDQKGTIFLSLLPGHPAVAGAPVFNSAPFVTKSNNQFVFHANMDEGEACDLYAVFTDRAGNAVTNALATGVDGDPDTFYTCTPTGLTANKIYSFAVLGTKGSSEVTREGVGTFFNGEVSVTAPAAVSENGGTGVFTFSRGAAADTGVPGGAVTVPFTLSGTATEFDNFREMVRTVTIPEGAASATVPVEDVVNLASGDTTLTLVPDPDGLYLVGTTGTATITDWTPPALADFDSTVIYKVAGYDANKAALANFPVLVRIPAGTVANAAEMAFFDANGAFLPYEVDTWDATGESLVWVLMPSLTQNATLTLASGNTGWTAPDLAPALWRTAGYVAVLHLGEDGPSFTGSTVQGIDGVGQLANGSAAGSANQVAGAVGPARLIDEASGGNQARIAVDNFEGYVDNLANMTISIWAKHSATRTPQNAERLFGNRSNCNDQATGLNVSTVSGVSTTTPVVEGDKIVNNMYALRDRTDGSHYDGKASPFLGFFFLRHDGEFSFARRSGYGNSTPATDPTLWGTGSEWNTLERFSPVKLHFELMKGSAYRTACADEFYRLFLRPEGAMTTERNIARFARRMAEIDDAIACEAARWGSTSLNRATWLTACNYCTNTFLASRMPHMLSQYRERGWYPSIDPSTVVDEQGVRYADGGEVPYGGKVALATTVDGGTVYYTTDGASDPMDAGATVYAGPFAIPDSGFTVRARVLKDGEWSALEEVALEADVPNDQRYGVRIAAIRNAAAVDPDEEFIVLTNVLDRAVPLEGLSIWSEKAGNALVKLAELGEGVEMPAGGTIRLEYADWLNGSDGKKLKLKNGAIYVELRDFNGKRIQNAYVNSEGWFQSVQGDKTTAACNKTGRWFVAREFLGDTDGGEVTEESQWAPSPQPWKKGTLILVN